MSYFAYIPSPYNESGEPLSVEDPARSAPAPEIFSLLLDAERPEQASPDHWSAAMSAAQSITQSGVLRDGAEAKDARYVVTVSGHTHNPESKDSPSYIQVNVARAYPQS